MVFHLREQYTTAEGRKQGRVFLYPVISRDRIAEYAEFRRAEREHNKEQGDCAQQCKRRTRDRHWIDPVRNIRVSAIYAAAAAMKKIAIFSQSGDLPITPLYV